MMKLTALKVDPEFQGKIPPLTFEELEQLEKNIVNDGKVINPIIVWNRLIVDGHNRYAILQKHPDIPYTVHEKEFADRFEVIICNVQCQQCGTHITWNSLIFIQHFKFCNLIIDISCYLL